MSKNEGKTVDAAKKRKALTVTAIVLGALLAAGTAGVVIVQANRRVPEGEESRLESAEISGAESSAESAEESGQESAEESKAPSVSEIVLDQSEYTVGTGKSLQIQATALPADAENNKITYSVADPSVASVDENGLVTGLKEGVTRITAQTANGVSAEAELRVSETVWIQMPQASYSWNATVAGSGHSEGWKCQPIVDESLKGLPIQFSSTDTSVARVDGDGVIVCYSNPGTCEVTASVTKDGTTYSASMKVYVNGGSLNIELVRSHEGAGLDEGFVYYYGCTCEDCGKNLIAYYGTYTRWLNGQKRTFNIAEPECPELFLTLGGNYFETAGNGHLRLKSSCESLTECKALELSFGAVDGSLDIAQADSIRVELEPQMTPALTAYAGVEQLSYIFPNEYNCFVLGNGVQCLLAFNTRIARDEFRYDSSRVENVFVDQQRMISFTPIKADGTPFDLVLKSAGGQKMTLHLIRGDWTALVSWANNGGKFSLKEDDRVSCAPTLDEQLVNLGAKVSYTLNSTNPEYEKDPIELYEGGNIKAVCGGKTSVSVEVSFNGQSLYCTYPITVDGYSVKLSTWNSAMLYYGKTMPCEVEVFEWKNGVSMQLASATDPEIHSNSVGSLVLTGDNKLRCEVDMSGWSNRTPFEVKFWLSWNHNGRTYETVSRTVTIEPVVDARSLQATGNCRLEADGSFCILDTGKEVTLTCDCKLTKAEVVNGGYSKLKAEGNTVSFQLILNSVTKPRFRLTTAGGQTIDVILTLPG